MRSLVTAGDASPDTENVATPAEASSGITAQPTHSDATGSRRPRTKEIGFPRNSPERVLTDRAGFDDEPHELTRSVGSRERVNLERCFASVGGAKRRRDDRGRREVARFCEALYKLTAFAHDGEVSMPFGSIFGAIVFGILGPVLGMRLASGQAAPHEGDGDLPRARRCGGGRRSLDEAPVGALARGRRGIRPRGIRSRLSGRRAPPDGDAGRTGRIHAPHRPGDRTAPGRVVRGRRPAALAGVARVSRRLPGRRSSGFSAPPRSRSSAGWFPPRRLLRLPGRATRFPWTARDVRPRRPPRQAR